MFRNCLRWQNHQVLIVKSKNFIKTNQCRVNMSKSKGNSPIQNVVKKAAIVDYAKPTRFSTIWKGLFEKHLLLTNTISAGVLMVAGDLLSQEIEYQRGTLDKRYDLARCGRMFLVGTLQGPLHHYFYGWMAGLMPAVNLSNTLKKILLDQTIVSPVCILLFFYPASLLEMKTLKEATDELREKFITVYITDWCVWPAAQFVNFHYLPSKYNVMFVNVMTMLYNIFLSYIKHSH